MENLFNADSYSITEAFAYAGVQSPFGTFQIPYSWGPILWGACLAILIAGIIFRLMQKYLVRAELSMPKGKGYLSIAIMAVLGVTWIILWTL
ncbi:MAG: hypothetical protein FWE48_06645, partial [Coriobacteriia bacterium]|nr:hypothetical protein [Coriobacteriia bacterium]